VGPAGSAEAVRLAVRSGARDFLPEPVNADELIAALGVVHDDHVRGPNAPRSAQVTVVVGAAGGVGASLVASNLAVALATESRTPTLLLDLDVNAAPLAALLDLTPERGLPSALAEVEYLDEHSLQGYVTKHRSGLHVLGAPARTPVPPEALDPARFATLLGFLKANYRHIVVDGSRHLDPLTLAAIGSARTVVVVLQQSVAQLKQAALLIGWLCNLCGIPKDHIQVAVNRYLKRSSVALDDIRRALGHDELTVLPSHYKSVLASIDSGVPLIEYDRTSPVTRAILELQHELVSGHRAERPGLLRRALPIFSGG
jgi:pilus assembly protein CpaE